MSSATERSHVHIHDSKQETAGQLVTRYLRSSGLTETFLALPLHGRLASTWFTTFLVTCLPSSLGPAGMSADVLLSMLQTNFVAGLWQ